MNMRHWLITFYVICFGCGGEPFTGGESENGTEAGIRESGSSDDSGFQQDGPETKTDSDANREAGYGLDSGQPEQDSAIADVLSEGPGNGQDSGSNSGCTRDYTRDNNCTTLHIPGVGYRCPNLDAAPTMGGCTALGTTGWYCCTGMP